MLPQAPGLTSRFALRAAAGAIAFGVGVLISRQAEAQAAPRLQETVLHWTAADGTPLEGKLSIPVGASRPVPVVFYLHGAGPSDADRLVRYRARDGTIASTQYLRYPAEQLASLGVAFFRMNKRGCGTDSTGRMTVDRAVFSSATPSVLLADYRAALGALRAVPDVDANRIVLYGSSEGTRLAPQLAASAPAGIVGLVLTSYQSDNARNTVTWQNTQGPWRNVVHLIPAAASDSLTKAAYDDAVHNNPSIKTSVPFAAIDRDSNGVVTPTELAALVRPRLDAIVNAVTTRDDDLLWNGLVNLTAAYMLEDWDGPPTVDYLLKLRMPIQIFHGELDGTTRVEGARETAATFRTARRTNLLVHTYPGFDHDLNWTPDATTGDASSPLLDSYRAAATMLKRKTRSRARQDRACSQPSAPIRSCSPSLMRTSTMETS